MTQFVALVVENDTLQREAMADALKSHALEVIECTTGEAAELVLASVAPELVALVIDIHLDGRMSGIELARFARDKYPRLKVVIVSGQPRPLLPDGALFLAKPYDQTTFVRAVLS
jgi:CheY-like chemotaxis protein